MHLNVDAFSQTNNCYTFKLVSKQSKCPGYVSQRRNICVGRVDLNQCRAEPLKCGAHQLRIIWGGSTLGRIDRHTCMWSKAKRIWKKGVYSPNVISAFVWLPINTYIVDEAKLVSSCFSFPSRANPLLSCQIESITVMSSSVKLHW